MEKPQTLISFWNGSSQKLHSYLNMEKRVYGMFGTNYEDRIGTYLLQFKMGKDGVNDTHDYLNFNKLHGRITPVLVNETKTMLLDFWEFSEDQVLPFLTALEQSIYYYVNSTPESDENYKTSQLLAGAKVSIGGNVLLKDGEEYIIAKDLLSSNLPPLMEIYLG